jgi:hypothetical protein
MGSKAGSQGTGRVVVSEPAGEPMPMPTAKAATHWLRFPAATGAKLPVRSPITLRSK